MNIRLFIVSFFLLFSSCYLGNVKLTQRYPRLAIADTNSGASSWLTGLFGSQPSLGGWVERVQVAIEHRCGRRKSPSPRPTHTATLPSDESGKHLVLAPFASMHRAPVGLSDDTWSCFAPFTYFDVGALFVVTILVFMICYASIMSAATETVRPSLADIGMQTDDVFIRSGTLTVDPCTCPDPPQTRDIAAVSEHCHSTEDSYNAEHSYDGKGPYSAYPVTVDCGDGDDGYCISSTERKWFDRARLEYSFDILERLSDSQLETLYSAYHALRDWHSGLPLDDDQHMALLRVCLIADKYRSRGELATPTTLLTSMAFRHTDKDDILGTIPRLVVEYYSEQ